MKTKTRTNTAKVEILTGSIVIKQNKILLIQEGNVKFGKKWFFPAGRVDEGESIEDATIRETKEESGLDVELIRELPVCHFFSEDVVRHCFAARVMGGSFDNREKEILDCKWYTRDEITGMQDKIRDFEWVRQMLDCLESALGQTFK